MQEPWTKNELDVTRCAELCAYKMYYQGKKLPHLIKSQITRYHHYNFGSRQFDSLPWLILHQFLMLVFEEQQITYVSSELIEDFNVRGAYMYRHNFAAKQHSFHFCDVLSHRYGQNILDSIVGGLVSMHATTGCSKCGYLGQNCSYCADGKLTKAVHNFSKYVDFKHSVFPVLIRILGKDRSAAIHDLSYFLFKWVNDVEFRLTVTKNEESWPTKTRYEFHRAKHAPNYTDILQDEELEDN
jgi:hypothetical protein